MSAVGWVLFRYQEPEDKEPYDKKSPLSVYLYCAVSLMFGFYFNTAVISRYQVSDGRSLSLDEAVASRAVIVIVFGSDGRAKGFGSQLINFKTVRDRKPQMSERRLTTLCAVVKRSD